MRTGSPALASMASLTPVASLQLCLPNQSPRPFYWSGWCSWELVGHTGPELVSLWYGSLTRAYKGVQGWFAMENMQQILSEKLVDTTLVIKTVLCVVCASRLFRNQTALGKRSGKNAQTQSS